MWTPCIHQEPDDAPKASLKQLQQLKAGEDLEGKQYKPFTPGADPIGFSRDSDYFGDETII